VSVVGSMLDAGAISEPGLLWWGVRLRPRLGTIEIRIMDAQPRVIDAAALTALVQCLVHLCAHGRRAHDPGPEVLAENRFLAARDGIGAQLIDDGARARRPALDAVRELLEECRPPHGWAALRPGASRSARARSRRRAATSPCHTRRPDCASRLAG